MTAFLSGLSPLIFPAWLDLPEAEPPPAKLAGSLRRTSPSTTARWQSERGRYREGVVVLKKRKIKIIFGDLRHKVDNLQCHRRQLKIMTILAGFLLINGSSDMQ